MTGNPDILICGNCRELFNDIVDMLEHKRIYCKMRFTCKCDEHEQGKCAPLKSIEFSAPSPTKKGKAELKQRSCEFVSGKVMLVVRCNGVYRQ